MKEGIVSTWATPSRVGRAEPAEEKPSLPGGGFSVPGLNQAAGVAAIKEQFPGHRKLRHSTAVFLKVSSLLGKLSRELTYLWGIRCLQEEST